MHDTHHPYFQQNLESNQRRRDLYQAMTANMESVFGFFLSLLEENYKQYKAHVGQQDSMTAHCHCRVMQVWLRLTVPTLAYTNEAWAWDTKSDF